MDQKIEAEGYSSKKSVIKLFVYKHLLTIVLCLDVILLVLKLMLDSDQFHDDLLPLEKFINGFFEAFIINNNCMRFSLISGYNSCTTNTSS